MAVVQHLDHAARGTLRTLVTDYRFPFVGGLLAIGSGLPLLVGHRIARRQEQRSEALASDFWKRVASLAPIVSGGLVAYQLTYAPGLEWLDASIRYSDETGSAAFFVPVLPVVQVLTITVGLLVTLGLASRSSLHGDSLPWRARLGRERKLVLSAALYWAGLLALMLTA